MLQVKFPISINFFKRVQNKMHYAVSKQTVAEIIYRTKKMEESLKTVFKYKYGKLALNILIKEIFIFMLIN